MALPNKYPGRCKCGAWVRASEGQMERSGGKWLVVCAACPTAADLVTASHLEAHAAGSPEAEYVLLPEGRVLVDDLTHDQARRAVRTLAAQLQQSYRNTAAALRGAE